MGATKHRRKRNAGGSKVRKLFFILTTAFGRCCIHRYRQCVGHAQPLVIKTNLENVGSFATARMRPASTMPSIMSCLLAALLRAQDCHAREGDRAPWLLIRAVRAAVGAANEMAVYRSTDRDQQWRVYR
jgi:hypothetical protein